MNNFKTQKTNVLILFIYLLLPCVVHYTSLTATAGLHATGDNSLNYVPLFKVLLQKFLNGDSLLWNEYILAGHPLLAEILTGVFYPGIILYLLLPFKLALNYSILLHFSLGGWFTYLYLRSINLSKTASFFGGTVFLFCPIFHILAACIPMLYTVTWFPLVMYFLEKRISSQQKKFLLFAALAFIVQIFAGFTQDSFYTACVVIIYSAMRYYSQYKTIKSFIYDMLFFGLIVISFSAIQLFPTYELLAFMQHSSQSFSWELIKAYSAPPLGFLTLAMSSLWGDPVASPLVGPTTGYFLSIYMGILIVIIAIYALRFWKSDSIIIIWLTLFALTLVIASGTYIMPIAKLLYNAPITHNLRVHSRVYFITAMATVVLFSYGLNYLLKLGEASRYQEIRKILKLGLLIGALLFVFLAGIIAGVISFSEIFPKLQGLTANSILLDRTFQYYQFFNPVLFMPFAILLLGGLILVATRFHIAVFFAFWLLCMYDIGVATTALVKSMNIPLNSFVSESMLKMKPLIRPTERVWVIYPDMQSFLQLSPNMNLNASALYDMQGIDGYVNFTDRTIKSLPNRDISSLQRLSLPKYGGDYLDLLQNHNDFISMLGIKYFIIDNKFAINIEKSYQKISSEWELIKQINAKDINISNNPLGQTIEHLYNKINIKPNHYYKIDLDVESDVNDLLYISLFNTNYSSLAQTLMFVPEKSTEKHFSGIINSGNNAPPEAYVRLVTKAKDLKISNISIYSSPGKLAPSSYKKVLKTDKHSGYLNPHAKERIYSLSDVRGEKGIDYINIDLLSTAVIDEDIKQLENVGIAQINQMNYQAGKVKAKVSCPADRCLIILSESYFPGWKAYVDEKKTRLYKVNDLIMGTFVDKGEHWVKFRYFPMSFAIGLGMFIFGLIWVPIWMILPRKRGMR